MWVLATSWHRHASICRPCHVWSVVCIVDPCPGEWACARYWLRFLLAIWVELPLYALRRKRYAVLRESLAVICVYALAVSCLWRINSTATIWAVLVPYVVTSFALMIGNW